MSHTRKLQYITDENGQTTSVVIPVDDYEEMLEDVKDLASIAERKEEGRMSLEELKKSLIADGLL